MWESKWIYKGHIMMYVLKDYYIKFSYARSLTRITISYSICVYGKHECFYLGEPTQLSITEGTYV